MTSENEVWRHIDKNTRNLFSRVSR